MAINKIILRDRHGKVIASDSFAALESVFVSIEGDVGTPSATSDYNNGVLSITLNNIKGVQGERGNGISSIERTATSDEDEGVNEWTITEDDGAQTVISLQNGSKGSRGNGIASIEKTESSEADEGWNEWTMTDDDGNVTRIRVRNGSKGEKGNPFTYSDFTQEQLEALKVKGDKGDQGDSAVYNPDDPDTPDFVMANTTGQSTTKAMTQKAVTDELMEDRIFSLTEINIASASAVEYYIDTRGKWMYSSNKDNESHIHLSVTAGRTVKIVSEVLFNVQFIKDVKYSVADANLATESLLAWKAAGTHYIEVPAGSVYIYFRKRSGGNDVLPTYVGYVNFTKDKIAEIDNINSMVLYDSVGSHTDGAMTQKSTFDEIMNDRVWNVTQLSIPSPSVDADRRPIDRATLKWTDHTTNRLGVRRSITSGAVYKLVGNATYSSTYAFLKTATNTLGTDPDFATNCTLSWLSANEVLYVTAPSDANYLYIEKRANNNDVAMSYLGEVELTKGHITNIEDKIDPVDVRVETIENAILERADFVPEYETVTPTAAETYNVDYLPNYSPNNIFRGIEYYKRRLAYFPDVRIAGGGTLTFTMTGELWIRVFELPWRNLNVAPNNANYKNTEQIAIHTYDAVAQTVSIELKKNTRRILIQTGHASGSIAPSAITDYITSVTLPKATIAGFTFGSDDNDNSDSEMSLVRHSTTMPPASTSTPFFKFIHYSDIHASTLAAGNILKAINKYGSFVDEIICTGDVIYSHIGGGYDGATWWPDCGLPEKSLYVKGNHDDWLDLNYSQETKAWSFNLYFKDYIDTLGYTMPTGYDDPNSPNYNACFWHKDYAQQKIRLIGLDCTHKFNGVVNPATGAVTTADSNTTNEQEVWLVDRLAETLVGSGDTAAGYSVIIVGHYPLDGFDGDNSDGNTTGGRIINQKTGEVSNWHRCSFNSYSPTEFMRWSNSNNHNNIAEIIKYYMEQDGSNFVAYFCGHQHNNMFFYPNRYPDILNISIDMAGNLRDMWYADQETMGGFIANLVTVSTSSKLIKIARLGVKSDVYLTPINYLSYNYGTRKIIQEG